MIIVFNKGSVVMRKYSVIVLLAVLLLASCSAQSKATKKVETRDYTLIVVKGTSTQRS